MWAIQIMFTIICNCIFFKIFIYRYFYTNKFRALQKFVYQFVYITDRNIIGNDKYYKLYQKEFICNLIDKSMNQLYFTYKTIFLKTYKTIFLKTYKTISFHMFKIIYKLFQFINKRCHITIVHIITIITSSLVHSMFIITQSWKTIFIISFLKKLRALQEILCWQFNNLQKKIICK